MKNSITIANLEAVIKRINEATGAALTPYTKGENGEITANAYNYHLSQSYGGYSLHRMASSGSGTSDVFSCGHVSKKELYSLMFAFIAGMEEGEFQLGRHYHKTGSINK